MIILRQVRNDETDRQLESVATSLNGVTRQCHVEIFLEAGEIYYCVPWSLTAQCDHSFRIVTYSGSAVAIKSMPFKSDVIDNCISQSFIREYALRALHSELIMCNDGTNVHPIFGPNRSNGVLLGTYGGNQYSFYILAINGSPDHYLSLRVASKDVDDSQFITSFLNRPGKPMNSDHQDFDIPPLSQKLLFVVTSTGTKKRGVTQKNPSFRYFSSWVVQKQTNSIVTRPSTSCKISFGGSMNIGAMGQRSISLHCEHSAEDRPCCNGKIETSFESVSMLLGRVAMHAQ